MNNANQRTQLSITMKFVVLFVSLLGLYPWAAAWRANRDTSLLYAINWAITAWVGWVVVAMFAEPRPEGIDPARYLAMSLTGCAAIAVLGARRPHVGAWNFVVLGLLAVMALPLAENAIIGPHRWQPLRIVFLGALLLVAFLNYLPTRFGWCALLFALCCTGETTAMLQPESWFNEYGLSVLDHVGLIFLPCIAWMQWLRKPPPRSQFDQMWLGFRDRFGYIWGQRVREQFNQAALNAGWPVYLRWRGLVRTVLVAIPNDDFEQDVLDAFQALTKRFRAPKADDGSQPAG